MINRIENVFGNFLEHSKEQQQCQTYSSRKIVYMSTSIFYLFILDLKYITILLIIKPKTIQI